MYKLKSNFRFLSIVVLTGLMFLFSQTAQAQWSTISGFGTSAHISRTGKVSIGSLGYSTRSAAQEIRSNNRQYGLSIFSSYSYSKYGLYSYISSTQSSATAIYGAAFTGYNAMNSLLYAGYFSGNVYSTGSYLPSFEALKKNVQEAPSAIDKLNQLEIKTYDFKQEGLDHMALPSGTQTGVMAGQMKELYPELVKKAVQPAITEEDAENQGLEMREEIEFEAVNYVGLIPHLVKAIQEQQAQIDQLKAELADYRSASPTTPTMNNPIGGDVHSRLFQNQPNPSRGFTKIPYFLADGTQEASIVVYNTSTGTVVGNYQLTTTGYGKVSLDASHLADGMYAYTLWVSGKRVGTKSMIIAR